MKDYSIQTGQAMPEAEASPVPTTGTFANLQLACIVPPLYNPRTRMDEAALKELAATIKAQGVNQPILVRPLPAQRVADTSRAVTHEIIAGVRRYTASLLAGMATIPALIKPMTDAQALEFKLIENLQREDLNAMEEAEGFAHFCQETGTPKEDIGAKIGRSRTHQHRATADDARRRRIQALAPQRIRSKRGPAASRQRSRLNIDAIKSEAKQKFMPAPVVDAVKPTLKGPAALRKDPLDAAAKKPKPAKPARAKMTAQEAQLGIAEAMQKDEATSRKKKVSFEVGQRVRVTTDPRKMRVGTEQWAGKEGAITFSGGAKGYWNVRMDGDEAKVVDFAGLQLELCADQAEAAA